jgi:hypothetical protein
VGRGEGRRKLPTAFCSSLPLPINIFPSHISPLVRTSTRHGPRAHLPRPPGRPAGAQLFLLLFCRRCAAPHHRRRPPSLLLLLLVLVLSPPAAALRPGPPPPPRPRRRLRRGGDAHGRRRSPHGGGHALQRPRHAQPEAAARASDPDGASCFASADPPLSPAPCPPSPLTAPSSPPAPVPFPRCRSRPTRPASRSRRCGPARASWSVTFSSGTPASAHSSTRPRRRRARPRRSRPALPRQTRQSSAPRRA